MTKYNVEDGRGEGECYETLGREGEKLLRLLRDRHVGTPDWKVAVSLQIEILRPLMNDVLLEVIDRDVLNKATEVFGEQKYAQKWLTHSAFGLEWKTPASLLNTPEGREQVMNLLGNIEYGVYT